ncbi:hypothetical protein EDC94DRAFT_671670 [Helicostylum pulchrum]|nr:hypothetical protein EDC94DRAFT_671670 [Helicostylum pulchrum]
MDTAIDYIKESLNSLNLLKCIQVKRKYTPPSPLLVARVERDPLLFGRLSVSTRIKEDAINNFLHYASLTDNDKYRVSLGLNSTISLTDVICQQVLFTDEEWNIIKASYSGGLRRQSKLPKDFKEALKNVNKKIRNRELDAAYKKSRMLEISANNECSSRLLSICSHIVRIYQERSYILSTLTMGLYSENDAIIKVWGEVFYYYYRQNVIGLKTDCRAVAYFHHDNQKVDLTSLEAGKEFDETKVFSDRANLVAEAKSTLDLFLNSSTLPKDKKDKPVIPIIQIARMKCELCAYRLVADGLYALDSVGSLSLPPLSSEFSENSFSWFQTLLGLKSMIMTLYDNSLILQQKNQGDFINSDVTIGGSNLTRGTFFPPTKASPIPTMPVNLYAPSCPPVYDDSKKQKQAL